LTGLYSITGKRLKRMGVGLRVYLVKFKDGEWINNCLWAYEG